LNTKTLADARRATSAASFTWFRRLESLLLVAAQQAKFMCNNSSGDQLGLME